MTSKPLIPQRPAPFTSAAFWWGAGAIGAIGLSLWQTGIFQRDLFNPGGWEQFWRFASASVRPDLSQEMVRLTLSATLKTLAYAVCGTWLSVILGLIGGVLGSEIWWEANLKAKGKGQKAKGIGWKLSGFRNLAPFLGIRGLLAVPRAIHELIWGLIFINLFGLDPLVGVLAIAVPFGAITAKVFAELLDETPRQPLMALLNSGVSPLTAFCYSLLPQAFLDLLSYTFYRFECSIRSAAVLGIIGAGGLGYEIMLSLQSLRYEQLWTFFYALVLLNGTVDFTSAWLRRRLGCASRLDLNLRRTGMGRSGRVGECRQGGQRGQGRSEQSPTIHYLLLYLLLPLALLSFSFWYVNADFAKLWLPVTWQRAGAIVQSSLPPDWTVLPQLTGLAWQTIAMSILAIVLAAVGGMLLSFPGAHNFWLPGGLLNPGRVGFWSRIWAWAGLLLARGILLFCRAIPAPIWALVVLYLVLPGILPGAIALGLHNLGILGRLKTEVTENLDLRPLEALKAQGAPAALVFLYGVLPMTLPRFLAYDLYRWEVCMRETVIVGLVGAGGLGRLLTEQLSSFDYRGMVVTLGGFVLLTFLVDWISGSVRRSLR